MTWKYGVIPFDDRAEAVGIFGIVTKPDPNKLITYNDVECKIVEELDWRIQQTNFVNAKWTSWFASNPGYSRDFVEISLHGLNLGYQK